MPFDHILQAVRWRRYLLSSWPWRGLGYVAMTYLLLPIIGFATLMLGLPWAAAVSTLSRGDKLHGILPMTILSTVLLVCGGPLVAPVFARLERWRLRIVDKRPALTSYVPSTTRSLYARYREAAAWRELAYLFLMAIVAPVVYGAVAALVFVEPLLLASPFMVALSSGPVTLWFIQTDSVVKAVPFALAGLALLPLNGYIFGLLAGGHAGLARALLTDSGASALREVTRSRARLVDAFETERRRIERDLHDGAQHRLTSLSLQLAVARLDVADGSPAAHALDKAHDQAKELMVVLRDLIHGIRPQVLTELGLAAVVAELAAQSAIAVTVTNHVTGRMPESVETTAFFAVSEALANVAKHSKANGAKVTLSAPSGKLVVEVGDDGAGGADPLRGSGLTGLADRVAAIGGRLLLSSPAGGPTLVRVELPWSR